MAGGSLLVEEEIASRKKKQLFSYNLLKYNRKDQVFKYCFVFYLMILQNKKDIV